MKSWVCIVFLTWVLFAQGEELGKGSDPLPSAYRLNGSLTTNALSSIEQKVLKPLVGFFRNEKQIAHGLIVDSRGFVLTKASSSVGARIVKTSEDKVFPVRIRKRNENHDLALWQITLPASEMETVGWSTGSPPALGSWAVAGDFTTGKLNMGVISAKSREISRQGGVMGIIFDDGNQSSNGVKVLEVLPYSAGDRGGLKVADIILRVDGRLVTSASQIDNLLQKRDPGDLLNLIVKRRGEEFDLRITLGHREVAFDMFNRNLLVSGPISKRKDNFPKIIQHDLPLHKYAMGGGLFDLKGMCVGINIARVDRVTCFSLPTTSILPVLDDWMAQFP